MAILKCKMCAGDLDIREGSNIAVCQYCGTKQTLPNFDGFEEIMLYNKATQLRQENNFDKAKEYCEQYAASNPNDSDAYWNMVLCTYGVEYVKDPKTNKRIPTINRTQTKSIYEDKNYKSAIKNADPERKALYEAEAATIDNIQKHILKIAKQEKPFDVFICYKQSDANGNRTIDSSIANDIYHQLKAEGLKVFFAEITLENKLGEAYEPYIFSALNSAKVMLVIGTKPEYFNAVWVKNEWSRYLDIINNDKTKLLIPCYRDMNAYDLPKEFAHLQAQDMSKIGFISDVVRGIKKSLKPQKVKKPKKFLPIFLIALSILLIVGFLGYKFKDNILQEGVFKSEKSEVEIQSITLNPNGDGRKIKMFTGCSYQFSTVVLPEEASSNALTWQSTNPSVATVDKTGKVSCVGRGETTIIVSSKDGKVSVEQNIWVMDTLGGFSLSNRKDWDVKSEVRGDDPDYINVEYKIPYSYLDVNGKTYGDTAYTLYDYSVEISGEYVQKTGINSNDYGKFIYFSDTGGCSKNITIKIKATLSDLWLTDPTFIGLGDMQKEIITEITLDESILYAY